MGCGLSSAERERLAGQYEDSQKNVSELKKQLQDRDQKLIEAKAQSHDAGSSVDELRAVLEARQAECSAEYQLHRDELDKQFERLQQGAFEDHERRSRSSRDGQSSPSGRQVKGAAPRQLSERDYVLHLEADAARRHREEAESSERQLQEIRERLVPLQLEHRQAAEDLREASEQVRAENEGRKSSATVSSNLESRLSETRMEHSRAEQRWEDLERHLNEQMKELRSELALRGNELRARDKHLQERDKELAEVNSQLADLQSLFDDVNQQLQTECGRIEQLQETVALCAKQGKELEALQRMLEESHRVLAQMRDALKFERAERAKAAELLEHEQQRTQLLLDVLKHFKEKLQGLSPQMLLSRLGAGAGGDIAKALFSNGTAMANGSGSGIQSPAHKSGQVPSPHPQVESRQGTKPAGASLPASRSFQGAYMSSPRRPASDGFASTIAPESSSLAPWVGSTGGSPYRIPPVSDMLSARPPAAVAQASPRGRPDWHRGPWESTFAAPSTGRVPSMGHHWDMGGGEAGRSWMGPSAPIESVVAPGTGNYGCGGSSFRMVS